MPGGGTEDSGGTEDLGGAWLLESQTLVSLGFQRFELSSDFVFCFESSTLFHKLAILLVTFFFGGIFLSSRGSCLVCEEKEWLGLGANTGFLTEGELLKFKTLLSISELEGTLFGTLFSEVGREFLEEVVRFEVRDTLEVREAAEEVLDAEDLTTPPLFKDCSLKA